MIVQYCLLQKPILGFYDMELNILLYALNEFKGTYRKNLQNYTQMQFCKNERELYFRGWLLGNRKNIPYLVCYLNIFGRYIC